jgi:predicted transcriptional regulator
MSHVNNVDDALAAVQKLVMRSPQSPMSKARHGLGVRRRVLNIVSDLSDLNRGGGVSRERVLEECSEAKIDLDKAEKYLTQLEDEGLISEMDGQLAPVECGDW